MSHTSYYADLVTLPVLGIASLVYALHAAGATIGMVYGFLDGLLLMSFIEYAVHRWLFHNVYRREHWQHHTRPAAYIGVPSYHTVMYFALGFCAAVGLFGIGTGTGLFDGVIVAYLIYIISHDRFHHGRPEQWTGYWARQAQRHAVHHDGKETNFGVSSPLWDHILGTYSANS